MVKVRTAVIRILGTGADTAVSALGEGKFALPISGKLVRASLALSTASNGPARGSIVFEPTNTLNEATPLGTGWLRADRNFGFQEPVIWNGEIPLGPNDHILFALRNDSGADVEWVGSWVTR